ncbi:divergent polysaccharide deacetylase family protein [Desulfolutivibrio sulfoxidireducens]|uniref:divergent polysaccharide deacetylase family protein n=1 Tax=Desulfolutivibrio sulfoxidireducens TaxID=2773299 RepID=UPI00159D7D6C|nr:divergent polysaccharide deacetylase family protein [Desulfolutivibrio sulfoxidireducens]QLA15830.1 divergent polysaccharide deacetylase family protein [Desulfolutivibrio sulfoxidireducens]
MPPAKKRKKTSKKKLTGWWPRFRAKLAQPAVLLFLAGLILGVTLVILGILFIGPQHRTPDGRPILERSHSDGPVARGKPAKPPRTVPPDQPRPERQPASPRPPEKALAQRADAPATPAKPAESKPETAPESAPEADLDYEEHFTGKGELSPEMEVVREYRGAVVVPAEPRPSAETPSPPPPPTAPRMAVVIDDLGDSVTFAKALLDLTFPVTLAILPHRPHSTDVDALGAKRGAEILLHQPMQPKGYPGVNPGRGALLTGMAPERIRDILDENLSQTPHASGVNNHMGSRFTEDVPGMVVVLQHLKNKDLFFLDSLTTHKSGVPAATTKAGGDYRRRYVFLDNTRDTRAILRQLKTAEGLAIKTGQALAIGHPYPETLQALRTFAETRDKRLTMVKASDMFPERAAGAQAGNPTGPARAN